MKNIESKIRFAIGSALFLIGFTFIIQLWDPSVFGQKHNALCWIAGIGGMLAGGYIIWTVYKKTGTGGSSMAK